MKGTKQEKLEAKYLKIVEKSNNPAKLYEVINSSLRSGAHDVDSNEKCRSCEVRYLCGGICKAWVSDRKNIDSGDFDCTERKKYFTRLTNNLRDKKEEY